MKTEKIYKKNANVSIKNVYKNIKILHELDSPRKGFTDNPDK